MPYPDCVSEQRASWCDSGLYIYIDTYCVPQLGERALCDNVRLGVIQMRDSGLYIYVSMHIAYPATV